MAVWTEASALLRHPLFLLAAGAMISGLLVPRVTRGWQDHRKALEVRAELVERTAECVTSILLAVQFTEVGAVSQTQADFDAAYRSWQKEKAVLDALFMAYFIDSDLDTSWLRCKAIATAYYVQAGIDGEQRGAYLRRVFAGLDSTQPKDLSEVAPSPDSPRIVDAYRTDSHFVRSQIAGSLDATVGQILKAKLAL